MLFRFEADPAAECCFESEIQLFCFVFELILRAIQLLPALYLRPVAVNVLRPLIAYWISANITQIVHGAFDRSFFQFRAV